MNCVQITALTAVVIMSSCSGMAPVSNSGRGKPAVYATNYPLAYFAERIAGDLVEVHLPMPDDIDPANWDPSDDAIEAFQSADLILLNGAGYAKWVEQAILPPSKLVDTSAALGDRLIVMEHSLIHTHGPQGGDSDGGTASTTWLDPSLAELQAAAVRDGLIRLLPTGKSALESGFTSLASDLKSLDGELEGIFTGLEKQPLLVSHPVYQYLARRYRLNIESVHWEPDQMPVEEEWSSLAQLLEKHPAKWMIWEGQPEPAISARLENLGVRSVVFEPCGSQPPTGDYLDTMNRNAGQMRLLTSHGP